MTILRLMALATATVWIALFMFVKPAKGETVDARKVYVTEPRLAGQRGLSLTPVRKAHGFALGCEAGYLFRDIVTDCPGVNRPSELAPLGVMIRRNSSGDRPVTRTITPSGVLISAIRALQLGASTRHGRT